MARLAEGDKKKQGKRGREGAFLEAEGELRRGTEDFKRILLRVLAEDLGGELTEEGGEGT